MPPTKHDPHESDVDSLQPLEALKVDLEQLEEGPQPRSVELPRAWVAEILAGTDAIAEADGVVRLELTLQSDRTLLVRGGIELGFQVPCARCLEPAPVDVGAETDELCVTFVPADRLRSWSEFTGKSEDEDEIEPLDPAELDEIGYHGSIVDLRKLISEQILLAYPMRILCARGEACLGLCMGCGANLNELSEARKSDEPLLRCPKCNVRLDGLDDEGETSPLRAALAKVEPPKNN